jgi:HlyD family secretion protein
MMKKVWVIASVLGVCAIAGGATLYVRGQKPRQELALAPDLLISPVVRGDLTQSVQANGPVSSNLNVLIKCRASGEVLTLPFDISQSVKKGDLLLQLDTKDEEVLVKQAEVNLRQAKSKVTEAIELEHQAELDLQTATEQAASNMTAAKMKAINLRKKADRQKQLLDQNLASPEDYETDETNASQAQTDLDTARIAQEQLQSQQVALQVKKEDIELATQQVALDEIQLKNAQQQMDYTTVIAPIDAVVADLEIQKGTIISSAISNIGGGTTVMTLADMSHIFVLASVDESDIGGVHEGQEVDITADSFPQKHFSGKVVRVATQGVNVSNVVTFEVKVEVTSANRNLLKPFMTASVRIIEATRQGVLTAPLLAIVRDHDKISVEVTKGDGSTPETRAVTLGIDDGENQEITSGVSEGEQVLVHRNESVSSWSMPRMPGMGMPGGGRRR